MAQDQPWTEEDTDRAEQDVQAYGAIMAPEGDRIIAEIKRQSAEIEQLRADRDALALKVETMIGIETAADELALALEAFADQGHSISGKIAASYASRLRRALAPRST